MTIRRTPPHRIARVVFVCLLPLLLSPLSGCDREKITKKRLKRAISASQNILADLDAARELTNKLAGTGSISSEDEQRLSQTLLEARSLTQALVSRGQKLLETEGIDTETNLVELLKLRDSTLDAVASVRDKGIAPLGPAAKQQFAPIYARISQNARKVARNSGCRKFFRNCLLCQPGGVIKCP